MRVDDQPKLADQFDLDRAREQCPSFDKFVRDVEAMIARLVRERET